MNICYGHPLCEEDNCYCYREFKERDNFKISKVGELWRVEIAGHIGFSTFSFLKNAIAFAWISAN